MFERRLFFHVDWLLLTAVLLIAAIGAAMIYSTTYVRLPDGTGRAGREFWTQLYALSIGGGALLWILLGPFKFQPSEFARMTLALILAMFFGENRRGARNTSDLVIGGIFVAVLFALIVKQPDLGSAMTLLPVFLGVAYLAGLRLRLLAIAATIAVLLAPVAWKYGLKDYQKSRIVIFIDPEQDPRGAGYQPIQARVTVGSGGLSGKGFMQGTQGQYKFLPVAHNDFIFSVVAEEFGFLGVLGALGLYLFVILRSLEAARLVKDRIGAYLVGGIISGFTFQVIYHVA